MNNHNNKEAKAAVESLMGTHRASNIERQLVRLREFMKEQERRPSNIPNGRAQKRSVNRSLYGVRSGTSQYRRESVASRSLVVSKMTEEEQQAMQANRTSAVSREEQMDRVWNNNYPIPTDKGVYLQ